MCQIGQLLQAATTSPTKNAVFDPFASGSTPNILNMTSRYALQQPVHLELAVFVPNSPLLVNHLEKLFPWYPSHGSYNDLLQGSRTGLGYSSDVHEGRQTPQ